MVLAQLERTTPFEKPTRAEALRYYRKVTDTFQLQVALYEKVLRVEREGDGADAVFAVSTRSHLGVERVREARAVGGPEVLPREDDHRPPARVLVLVHGPDHVEARDVGEPDVHDREVRRRPGL